LKETFSIRFNLTRFQLGIQALGRQTDRVSLRPQKVVNLLDSRLSVVVSLTSILKVMTTPLDTPWKQILESYFPQFMAFFFPEAYSQIDWSRGFEFLDGELQQITLDAETGKRIIDKLAKVYLHSGGEQWIAAHIEIQNQKEDEFGERVFVYFARLRDKFNREVASFAVLGDTNVDWRPNSFVRETLGCNLHFSFPITKLVDYKKRQEELAASYNPFAVVVLAHLTAQATKGKESQQRRKHQKLNIMKMMYDRGYSRQEVINLYRFVDWVLTLPTDLAEAFDADLIAYEGEKNMPYVSELERKSLAAGEAKVLIKQLSRQKPLSEEMLAKIEVLPIDRLEQLAIDLLDFTNSNDLAEWLQRYGQS
jgi:Domain of unknown function (DUF4351)